MHEYNEMQRLSKKTKSENDNKNIKRFTNVLLTSLAPRTKQRT